MTYLQLLSCCLLLFLLRNINADDQPPNPGYYPTNNISKIDFYQGFKNQWGPQHQQLISEDGVPEILQIWLDSSSGSGFKSRSKYKVKYGYIGADIKLDNGSYTAGVDTSFYLSSSDNCTGQHDEVDIEFLGHTKGNPYVLSTNVYVNGHVGDGIDRGERFHLWFDPSANFHNYAIYWDPTQIIFLVDDIPIRKYPESSSFHLPRHSMKAYGSIWDASDWATDNGQSKANYQRQESFQAYYKNFRIQGCTTGGQSCSPVTVFPDGSTQLSDDQKIAMEWVKNNCIIHN